MPRQAVPERRSCRHARLCPLAGALFLVQGVVGSALAADGAYTPGVTYTVDAFQVRGGVDSGSSLLQSLGITLAIDAEAAWGLRGGTAFLYLLGTAGDDINEEHVGSLQGVDNIEANNAGKVFELWYEQVFARGSLRGGLYDLNSEFDSIDTAGLFINPSHGIGVDYAQAGPSLFPVTALALRYAGVVAEHGYWQAAVLDGVPGDPDHPRGTRVRVDADDGALLALEAGVRRGAGETLWHWGVGAWQFTEKTHEDAAGNPLSGRANRGVYGFAEREFARGIAAFGRVGIADDTINQVASYVGAGMVRTGIGGRADDQLGLAVAIANMSANYRAATGSDRREIIWELSYRTQLTDWLALQPDVQYVVDPGADPALDAAWVVGARLEIGF